MMISCWKIWSQHFEKFVGEIEKIPAGNNFRNNFWQPIFAKKSSEKTLEQQNPLNKCPRAANSHKKISEIKFLMPKIFMKKFLELKILTKKILNAKNSH